MFLTNSLLLRIYNAEFHKDPFLNLCYFRCIYTIIPQAVDCELYIVLYSDDACLLFQHKDLEWKKEELTVTGFYITSWALTLGRIKLNLSFSQKQKKENWNSGQYGDVKIKQYSKVTYLGCEVDESLSGGAMAFKVLNKINGRLKFLYRKNRYVTPYLKRLLCDALIQPHFDYACSAWYPSLNEKFRSNQLNCPK